jgi:hypothetical protein
MYRQMKSEKFTLNHVVSGSMLLYRQIHLNQFRQVSAALTAYEVADNKVGFCDFVLNELGEEFYIGIPMSKSRQSDINKAHKEPAITPQDKRATKKLKKEYQTLFGNSLTAIKLRCAREQALVCS